MSERYLEERRQKREKRRRKTHARKANKTVPRVKDTRGRLRKLQAVELSERELEAARRWGT